MVVMRNEVRKPQKIIRSIVSHDFLIYNKFFRSLQRIFEAESHHTFPLLL